MKNPEAIQLYVFHSAWNMPIPTVGPFALKLITWCRMAGIPHELCYEDDTSKGPKQKNPWIVRGDVTMGDTELIFKYLKKEYSVDPNAALTPKQKHLETAFTRMLEEHYHQIWEYEAIVADGGWEFFKTFFDPLPEEMRDTVANGLREHLRQQLHARGIGRHSDEDRIRMGFDDLDALASLLGEQPFFFGNTATDFDACAFGFLGVTKWLPHTTPLFRHFRKLDNLNAFCERMREAYCS